MTNQDENEKTVVAGTDTFFGKIQEAGKTPPTVSVLIGPQGYVGKQWPLLQAETIVGRSIECSIFIDDKSLSRSHAKFLVFGSEVSVVDMGSTNKTVVNGTIIPPLAPYNLKNNDQIKTGNIVFRFLEKGSLEAMSSQEVLERVSKDMLTGAYTKAELSDRGPELIRRAETLSEPLCIIVFDIDFFKKVNDTYGHAGGDLVLREIGRIILTKLVRSNDFFVRYGGEEFVILLSGSSLRTAHEVAERIRQTVQGYTFEFEGKIIPVTVSLGITEKLNSDKTWEHMFERADKALYVSKQTGRNKTTLG